MFDKQLLLHLSLIDGIGPATIHTIVTYHSHEQQTEHNENTLYSLSSKDIQLYYALPERIAQKIVVGLQDKKLLEDELVHIERNKIKWTTIADDAYPPLLREIYLPPSVLYWQGEDFHTHIKTIAFVGSRKANAYAQRVINKYIPDLVSCGWTIVSGGAFGADTMAHQAAINAGGKTIVVFGSGLLQPYPSSNNRLFKTIRENGGTIVSTFPLATHALPGNFPARNRIISGLSHGCVVVQAAQKSGALITAHYALEQGREVFAVPGSIDDELSVGSHELIKNGAQLIVDVADIIREFGEQIPMHTHPLSKTLATQIQAAQEREEQSLTEIQRKIIGVCYQPLSLDGIVMATNLSLSEVQIELFDLQIAGKITQDFSGMWTTIG